MTKKFIRSSTGTHLKDSDYKGVKWDPNSLQWSATLKHKGIVYNCGYFSNERDAAKARDIKIIAIGATKPLQILKSTK
ncbi:hypothetical protein K5I29_02350 [Flavobacterium agricola]|uniref:Uncharacterized protein n=1 Tax=Flavobacterium agricola TaxID=2870839 RepID=A0ABY6M002_9FLAO|nr:hypothetical protein [Flavobacterium agricola]UYW01786.1 hypothetical protein K5I29_02350 [Flavobacterium agricola]